MCGQMTLTARLNRLLSQYAAESRLDEWLSGDIRPTNDAAVIRISSQGRRELVGLRWWLIPSWSKEPKTKFATFNARSETIADLASFKAAFKTRRCLVIADGWYEWKVVGGTPKKPVKQKHLMRMPDGEPFAMAGLWERWQGNGLVIDSCTIATTSATPELAEIHDRMPVILPPEDHDLWLDPEFQGRDKLLSLLRPYTRSVVSAECIVHSAE